MKGLLFSILIYAFATLFSFLIKYGKEFFGKKNRSEQTPTSKIYYITNYVKKKKPIKKVSPDIAIKGSIVDKENLED